MLRAESCCGHDRVVWSTFTGSSGTAMAHNAPSSPAMRAIGLAQPPRCLPEVLGFAPAVGALSALTIVSTTVADGSVMLLLSVISSAVPQPVLSNADRAEATGTGV